MTRIVAGSAKGRPLTVAKDGTRPTAGRAREAMFASLQSMLDLDGAHVLDLYAGSGAVGLEALSRGAASATLVEQNRAACAAITANITAVGLPGATLVRRDVASYLADLSARSAALDVAFDFVFADPPYDYADPDLARVLERLAAPARLAADAVVVVERSVHTESVPWPDRITPGPRRRYGDGVLWYGRAS